MIAHFVDDDPLTRGSLLHDFVVWWSYARLPIAAFVMCSSFLTWFFIYQNRHRFEVIVDKFLYFLPCHNSVIYFLAEDLAGL